MLQGCATDPTKTGSISKKGNVAIESMTVPQLRQAADRIGKKYQRNPKDKAIGLQYADILRTLGWRWDELCEHTDVDRPEDLARFPALGVR